MEASIAIIADYFYSILRCDFSVSVNANFLKKGAMRFRLPSLPKGKKNRNIKTLSHCKLNFACALCSSKLF